MSWPDLDRPKVPLSLHLPRQCHNPGSPAHQPWSAPGVPQCGRVHCPGARDIGAGQLTPGARVEKRFALELQSSVGQGCVTGDQDTGGAGPGPG